MGIGIRLPRLHRDQIQLKRRHQSQRYRAKDRNPYNLLIRYLPPVYFSTGTTIPLIITFCANKKTVNVGMAAMISAAYVTETCTRC